MPLDKEHKILAGQRELQKGDGKVASFYAIFE